jgi:hypothetical protein
VSRLNLAHAEVLQVQHCQLRQHRASIARFENAGSYRCIARAWSQAATSTLASFRCVPALPVTGRREFKPSPKGQSVKRVTLRNVFAHLPATVTTSSCAARGAASLSRGNAFATNGFVRSCLATAYRRPARAAGAPSPRSPLLRHVAPDLALQRAPAGFGALRPGDRVRRPDFRGIRAQRGPTLSRPRVSVL